MEGNENRTGWRGPVLAGGLAALAVPLATAGRGVTPFAPGELDLVLGARLVASGSRPWPWEAAVHPDAYGTFVEAVALAPLLGLGDVTALRLLGALHLGVLVGVAAWLGRRLGGSLVAAALLALAPSVIAAHTRTMGTTTEAGSVQLATLAAGLVVLRKPSVLTAALLGLPAGLSVAYSVHGLLLAGLLGVALFRAKHLFGAAFAATATGLAVGLRAIDDPARPAGSMLQVLDREPWEVLALLGPGDVIGWLGRLPGSALPEHGPLGWLWGLAVVAGLVLAGRAVRQGGEGRLVGAYAGLLALSLLPAADLMGYPAAWRYHALLIPPLAALASTRVPWPAAAVAAAVALALAPGRAAPELDRPAAAFYAGQHRVLVQPSRALHPHARRLWPVVSAPEQEGFAQGYGLHLGRELDDLGGEAGTFWAFARELPERRRAGFARAFGLGLAEDGVLSEAEQAALRGCPAELQAEAWFGVGAAQGERAHRGLGTPLQAPWAAVAPWAQAVGDGIAETRDGAAGAAGDLLPADAPAAAKAAAARPEALPQRRFALRHPLAYAPDGDLSPAPR